MDLVDRRLSNQKLTSQPFSKPEEVVSWFGAVQAQDFAAAKWALTLRSQITTDKEVEDAFNKSLILRTHVMRPTWHFVSPQDIRWLLKLTSERVQRFNGSYFRRSGYDREIFKKTNKILEKNLSGQFLTREEIKKIMEINKIPLDALGLSFVMMQAELEGVVVSGPKKGKQFTYALFEERVPKYPDLDRDQALSELVKRYFQSHGPAQIKDFVWWSGLTVKDTIKGISMQKGIQKEKIEGKDFYFFENSASQLTDSVFLVPAFDEYFVAYSDRSEILEEKYKKHLNLGGGMINGAIIVNGKMVGGWKRIIFKNRVDIQTNLLDKITSTQRENLEKEVEKFGKFLNLNPVIV